MIDAERAVLGSCLLDPQAYWQVADLLRAEDFCDAAGRGLWTCLTDLVRGNQPSDPVAICDSRPEFGELALELASSDGYRSANVRAYADMVVRQAANRRVHLAGQRIAKLDSQDAYAEAQQLLAQCAPRALSSVRPILDYVRESVAALQARVDAGVAMTGLPSGMERLDEWTGGWQDGDLVVLAARPSVGKTAVALQWTLHAASQGKRALVFSLEMSGVQIVDRMQAHLACVDSRGLRDPRILHQDDYARLFQAAAELQKLPVLLDDGAGMTVDAICARARQAHAESPLGLVVIDYLTQITPPQAENTNAALQIVTRQLKMLARELRVPVLLLSQLNRAGEHRPTLTSLRDTGALEQDADVVTFLHRPQPKDREKLQLIVEKQRNGPTGEIWIDADYAHMHFAEGHAPAAADVTPMPRQRGFGRMSGGWEGY